MSAFPDPVASTWLGRVALAAVLVLLGCIGHTQSVVVQIGEPADPVPPRAIAGFNYGLSMQVALYREEFEALKILGLRFPPGNDADNYPITTDMIDALRTQWNLLGNPELLVVTNFFEGPDHAVHAAQYFEQIGMPVRLWSVGNEPDLYPQNRMDPSWTPEVYCERFRAIDAALDGVNPQNVVTGPAVSGSRPLGVEFLRQVLYLCGDVIDILTWHVYPTDGTWTDEAALATSPQVGEEIRLFRQWLEDPEMNPLGFERDIDLAITEFGLSWRTQSFRHLEDMVAAVWLADVLGQMVAERLDASYYFALQAMGGHGLIDRGGWIRPTYWVYEMLSDFSGAVVAARHEQAGLGAYAVQNPSGLQVLLVNRTDEALDVTLQRPSATLPGQARVTTLDEAIYDAELTYRVTMHSSDQIVAVPARSVVLVHMAP